MANATLLYNLIPKLREANDTKYSPPPFDNTYAINTLHLKIFPGPFTNEISRLQKVDSQSQVNYLIGVFLSPFLVLTFGMCCTVVFFSLRLVWKKLKYQGWLSGRPFRCPSPPVPNSPFPEDPFARKLGRPPLFPTDRRVSNAIRHSAIQTNHFQKSLFRKTAEQRNTNEKELLSGRNGNVNADSNSVISDGCCANTDAAVEDATFGMPCFNEAVPLDIEETMETSMDKVSIDPEATARFSSNLNVENAGETQISPSLSSRSVSASAPHSSVSASAPHIEANPCQQTPSTPTQGTEESVMPSIQKSIHNMASLTANTQVTIDPMSDPSLGGGSGLEREDDSNRDEAIHADEHNFASPSNMEQWEADVLNVHRQAHHTRRAFYISGTMIFLASILFLTYGMEYVISTVQDMESALFVSHVRTNILAQFPSA
jgi:hypothetical protein